MGTFLHNPGIAKYRYRPKADITPDEIARLTPILIGLLHSPDPEPWVHRREGSSTWDDTIAELPQNLRRHFKTATGVSTTHPTR